MTQHYAMLQRNLLYTGVTRGKRLVVLVGQKKAVAIAVRCPFTADLSAPCFGEHPVAEPRGAAGGRSSRISSASMSPCGGECRVGRSRCRAVARRRRRTPAPARRRSAAPPASPVRHQQTIATNKRSTSAAARRPPAAAQSAAQASRGARAPRRSISYAHRSPQPRAPAESGVRQEGSGDDRLLRTRIGAFPPPAT